MKHINLGASKASVNDKFVIAELTVSSVDQFLFATIKHFFQCTVSTG